MAATDKRKMQYLQNGTFVRF